MGELTLEVAERRATPPDRTFLGMLGAVLVGVLLAVSTPGLMVALFGALLFPGMMLGLFWLFRLARALALGIGWPEVKRWWPAPALVAVTLLLIMVDAPFRLRFELARGSFDELAAEFEAGDLSADNGDFDVLTTVGSFTISRAYPVDEGFILYEQHGNFFDNAGFAYLPEGPDDSLANGGFEAPSFPSLGGDWYAWTASW